MTDNIDFDTYLDTLYAKEEKRVLTAAIANSSGNVSFAARALCISRGTMIRKLEQHDIRADDFVRPHTVTHLKTEVLEAIQPTVKEFLVKALKQHDCNAQELAFSLSIPLKRLYNVLHKYEVSVRMVRAESSDSREERHIHADAAIQRIMKGADK